MSEKPLDRLNYFNGQRLEASDLKLEQQYHIRVRRWLNKSLYTTGIARGLEVVKDTDPLKAMNVIVSPGLALDSEGREIILLDQISIGVVGKPSIQPGVVDGNYLVIQYNEQVTEEEQDGCALPAGKKNGCGKGSALAWGGPALVRAQAILGWTDALPSDTSGKIILAQVELKSDCTVNSVHPEVRRYVGAASEALVRQFALEGARDFDAANPQRIYFHVRGRQPNAVTLYLRAEKFSTLYYTELGQHSHGGNLAAAETGPAEGVDRHAHSEGSLVAQARPHNHEIFANDSNFSFASPPLALGLVAGPGNFNNLGNSADSGMFVSLATPTMTISGETGFDPAPPSPAVTLHKHPISAASVNVGPAGVTDVNADSGRPARTYIDNLQISINGNDQTASIQTQLQDANPTEDWTKLGDGTASHALVVNGTGEIKLDFLSGARFLEGEHVIELSVTSGGGRILYNLYVE
jgi:hypothetical protein